MNRLLVAIALLQIALIAYLILKVESLEEKVNAPQQAEPASSLAPVVDKAGSRNLTAAEIRAIFANELMRHREEDVQISSEGAAPRSISISESDPAAYQQQVDAVHQTIEFYRSVGDISVSQMQALQLEIGRLEEPARQEALNSLVRALNNGEIDGQL